MSAPAGGTGFAFFCDDFRPAPRDPLSCELCGNVEGAHPVLADVAPVEIEPVDRPPIDSEDWHGEMIARCERIAERIQGVGRRLDGIDERLRALKLAAGIP